MKPQLAFSLVGRRRGGPLAGRTPFGGGRLISAGQGGALTYNAAFAADLGNSPWYIATTPALQKFADLGASGQTVVVWQAYSPGFREIHIQAYDHATKVWSRPYLIGTDALIGDDHGVPSLCRDSDGYFWVFGAAHSSNMKVFRSTNPNDISAWTAQSDVAGAFTYPHPNNVGGKLHLFMRDAAVSTDQTLALYAATPSAGSISWGSKITVADFGGNTRWYQGNCVIRGTDIWMCATKSDAADTIRQHVYILIYDTTDGSVRNLSGTRTDAAGALPLNLTTLDTYYRRVSTVGDTGNIPQICFDTSDNLHMAYMDGSLGSAFSIYHKMYSASSGYVTPTTPEVVAQTDANNDLHRYDSYTVAPQGDGIDFYSVSAAGLGFTRGGNISLAHRSAAGTWTGPNVIRAAQAQGGQLLALDVPVMVRDGGDDFNAAFAEISYIQTLGVTGTESFIARAFGYGNGSGGNPAAPFIGSSPYGPDVDAYVKRLSSTPSATVKAALRDFVDQLRQSDSGESWKNSLWITLPCMPDATDALVNFRSVRYAPMTKVGSPVFENPGYRNVASAYFDTGIGFNTRFAGTNFHFNSLFKPNASATSCLGTAGSTSDLVSQWDGSTALVRIGGTETVLSQAFSATIGVLGGSRTGTTVASFGNGAKLGSKTATNAALTSGNLLWGSRAALSSLHTYYAQSLGFYMSDAAMATMAAAMKSLVNRLAGGIVP